MTLNEVFLGILTLAVVVLVIFLVGFIRRASETMKLLDTFLSASSEAIQSAVTGLRQNMESLKHVTDNMTTVTEDFKVMSGSVREIGESVKQVGTSVQKVSALVEDMTASASTTACGVVAGVKAGFGALVKGLLK